MKKFLIILCLGICSLAIAQPQISGPQYGTLGPGSYIVIGDIQVRPGESLTITPGTTFLHNGNWKWTIAGTLNAVGTSADSIKFVRQSPTETCKWAGLRFEAGASASSIISYGVIEWCKHGVSPYYTYGTGIYSNGIAITVTHSRISNCDNYWDGGGIYITNAAATLSHNLIVDNSASSGSNGGGIVLNNCIGANVSYNVVARNAATGT
jgi:hypothetical protein